MSIISLFWSFLSSFFFNLSLHTRPLFPSVSFSLPFFLPAPLFSSLPPSLYLYPPLYSSLSILPPSLLVMGYKCFRTLIASGTRPACLLHTKIRELKQTQTNAHTHTNMRPHTCASHWNLPWRMLQLHSKTKAKWTINRVWSNKSLKQRLFVFCFVFLLNQNYQCVYVCVRVSVCIVLGEIAIVLANTQITTVINTHSQRE